MLCHVFENPMINTFGKTYMFGTLFGKATALSEVGDTFRARCKTAAQRQVSDAETMNSAISEKLGHVEDCIAVTEKAIKLQKDGIAELQKKKATPVEQRDPKSVHSHHFPHFALGPIVYLVGHSEVGAIEGSPSHVDCGTKGSAVGTILTRR
jgi:hypothetical protein